MTSTGFTETGIRRLDRYDLLAYREVSGGVKSASTVSEWELRRAEIIRGMTEVMGPLPGDERRSPLDVQVLEEVDCGTYTRKKINYQSEPGSTTSAYLLVPEKAETGKDKLPAILALHSTSEEFGYGMAVGLGKRENRDYGHQLAEKGYVVLAPSYPQMAEYRPDLKRLGYKSGTMKAIWDNIRGLDLLDSLPYVDGSRYGVIGHSLGGHNAIFTAVFDKRLKVIVSSCGFDSFLDYMNGNLAGWQQERYMPQLAKYAAADIPFDFPELIAALAPRLVFISAPTRDDNFQWDSVDRISKAAGTIFQLYGVPQNLIVKHPDCAHDFPDEVKDSAFQVLDQHLKRGQ